MIFKGYSFPALIGRAFLNKLKSREKITYALLLVDYSSFFHPRSEGKGPLSLLSVEEKSEIFEEATCLRDVVRPIRWFIPFARCFSSKSTLNRFSFITEQWLHLLSTKLTSFSKIYHAWGMLLKSKDSRTKFLSPHKRSRCLFLKPTNCSMELRVAEER